MQPTEDFAPYQPTLLAAMWRYKWVVVVSILLFAALGVAATELRPSAFQATASLVVQDSDRATLFDTQEASTAEAFLAVQQGIISTQAVAQRAGEIAAEEDLSAGLTSNDLIGGLSVSSDPKRSLLTVVFQAGNARDALAGANAIAMAYQEIRKSDAESKATAEADQLDEVIRLIDTDIATLQDRVDELRPADSAVLDEQLATALAELVDLRNRRPRGTDLEREAIRSDLNDLFRELQTAQLLQALEERQPALAALLQSLTDELDLQRQLTSRRNELRIEASLASSGVVLFSPAREAVPRGLGLIQTLVIMVILGGAVGAGLAFYLTIQKRIFQSRLEPEILLGRPLLAEIPDFKGESFKSDLPARDAPASVSSESFRFVAASIDSVAAVATKGAQAGMAEETDGSGFGGRVLVTASATIGDGKTVVTANTAYAAAKAGSRVLVIDGDFSSQELSRLLLGKTSRLPGFTDCVMEGMPLARTYVTVEVPGGVALSVMGRGQVPASAATVFRSQKLPAFIDQVRDLFDLVLIDAPPLLQVAYSGALVRLADGAIVVVRHRSEMADLEELRNRLELTGIPILGYLYNRAPLRRDLAGPEGSIGEISSPAMGRSRRSRSGGGARRS